MGGRDSGGRNLPAESWYGSPNNRWQTSLRPRSRRRKSFTESNCSPKVSGATACWLKRKGCLQKTSRDVYSHSRATLRAILQRLRHTVGRLEDPSATRTHRSQPLPGRMEPSLQQGMAPTFPIAALLSSIPGARPREKARHESGKPGTDRTLHHPTITWIPQPHRAELASGEILQSAKTSVEFGRRQAPQAVERA